MNSPRAVQELEERFSTEENCRAHLVSLRSAQRTREAAEGEGADGRGSASDAVNARGAAEFGGHGAGDAGSAVKSQLNTQGRATLPLCGDLDRSRDLHSDWSVDVHISVHRSNGHD